VGAPWARPIRLFGLQGASNYGVRPDIVTAAIPSIDGSAAAPTTLDVYVNNVKTYSRDLPIGPYSLQNIPGLYGSGQAEIVTRDATGREVRSRLPFFATSSLLRPGIIEFGAQLGFARYYYAVSNFTYGDKPLGVATLRGGVTDGLTLQAHAEGGAGLTNLGGGASFNFFNTTQSFHHESTASIHHRQRLGKPGPTQPCLSPQRGCRSGGPRHCRTQRRSFAGRHP
jgi:outer membrane usher protein